MAQADFQDRARFKLARFFCEKIGRVEFKLLPGLSEV